MVETGAGVRLLFIGLAMTALCLALQIGAVSLAQRYYAHVRNRHVPWRRGQSLFRITVIMVLLMLGIFVQMLMWGLLFFAAGLFASAQEALYFSGVTFTSLGYGDVVIHGHVRLLAPMEAATGLMMFAIVTAVLIGVIQQEAKAHQ
jgi:hypothetical protein